MIIKVPTLLRSMTIAVLLLGSWQAMAKDPVAPKPMTLSFGGVEYVHRWSQKGQNEFTPPAQPDLKKWRDMVTVNVHDQVRNGDQLAALANGVLGNYQRAGKIVRTDSKPRTPQREAEHLIVAVLAADGVMEAAFARVMLVEGKGVIVVYSHRAYGKDVASLGPWLESKGEATETTLMAWNKLPKLADIKALPQSK
jgi:hypothetical protein